MGLTWHWVEIANAKDFFFMTLFGKYFKKRIILEKKTNRGLWCANFIF